MLAVKPINIILFHVGLNADTSSATNKKKFGQVVG